MPVYRRIVNNSGVKNTAQSGRGLLGSASLVAFMTLLSRIFGFMRDIVLASVFGAGGSLDAFLVAFKIPNFFRRLFGEGAFSQAFVPLLANLSSEEQHETVLAFISRVFSNLALCLMILVALAEAFAPGLIWVFAPGFDRDPERLQLATHMLRVTFPYILLISLTAMSAAVLNTHKRFALPAFTPVLLNVALITVALCWAPHVEQPVYVLAWGVILGGVLQLALQIPTLIKLGLLPRIKVDFQNPNVRKVLKLMVPALFGVSVAQISLLIDNCFASFLPRGSISWLYYSDRLTYLPLGVIGVALATVVLPTLSRQRQDQPELYSATLGWALRTALFAGLPAAMALMVLAGPLLATMFLHGQFSVNDVLMSSRSLLAFAFGLPAFMLIKILASAFYARENIKTPVKIAAVALGINVIGNFILIHIWAHAGLALSTSIAAYFNAGCLWFMLWRCGDYKAGENWWWPFSRLFIACAVMVAALLWLTGDLSVWLHSSLSYRIEHIAMLVSVGLLIYLLVMWLLGWRTRELRF